MMFLAPPPRRLPLPPVRRSWRFLFFFLSLPIAARPALCAARSAAAAAVFRPRPSFHLCDHPTRPPGTTARRNHPARPPTTTAQVRGGWWVGGCALSSRPPAVTAERVRWPTGHGGGEGGGRGKSALPARVPVRGACALPVGTPRLPPPSLTPPPTTGAVGGGGDPACPAGGSYVATSRTAAAAPTVEGCDPGGASRPGVGGPRSAASAEEGRGVGEGKCKGMGRGRAGAVPVGRAAGPSWPGPTPPPAVPGGTVSRHLWRAAVVVAVVVVMVVPAGARPTRPPATPFRRTWRRGWRPAAPPPPQLPPPGGQTARRRTERRRKREGGRGGGPW